MSRLATLLALAVLAFAGCRKDPQPTAGTHELPPLPPASGTPIGYLIDNASQLQLNEQQITKLQEIDNSLSARNEGIDTQLREIEKPEVIPEDPKAPPQRQNMAPGAQPMTTTADAVNSRLKRARELLRRRLERRGLVVSAGVFWAAWHPASADILSPSLLSTTIKAAGQFALNLADCAATPRAAALARGAISTMTPVQKLLAGFVLLAGCLLAAAGGLGPAASRGAGDVSASVDAAPAVAAAGSSRRSAA